MRRGALVLCFAALAVSVSEAQGQRARGPAAPPLPVMVIETVKGPIEVQLFSADAPKSVEHIIALVKRGFYRSQRFHRVEPFLAQFGDPSSRDMTLMTGWGRGSSNSPIGVVEWTKRKHVRGAVGLAHAGNPTLADSQLYILKTAHPALDRTHVVIGQVTVGMAVVDKLEKADMLKMVMMKEVAPK